MNWQIIFEWATAYFVLLASMAIPGCIIGLITFAFTKRPYLSVIAAIVAGTLFNTLFVITDEGFLYQLMLSVATLTLALFAVKLFRK